MTDPIATQTLYATWISSVTAVFASLWAVWIAHQANARDDRRRAREEEDRRLAFDTAVRLAVRKAIGITRPVEDAGDGTMTRSLFVQGVRSARQAIDFALGLGVADAGSLETAFDTGSALNLLSVMLASLGPDEFIGPAAAATREELRRTMAVLRDKHPSIFPAGSAP